MGYRIKAHFTTCLLALLIYRILEHKLEEKYTSSKIIKTLRDMNLRELEGVGYIPTYTRITITDDLHNVFNFRTDNEITILKDINKIFKNIKNKYNHALFINVVKACSTVIHCITGFLLFQKCQTRDFIFIMVNCQVFY